MRSLLFIFLLLARQVSAETHPPGLQEWNDIHRCVLEINECGKLGVQHKRIAEILRTTLDEVKNKKALFTQRLGPDWEKKLDQPLTRAALLEIKKTEWSEISKMYQDLCPATSQDPVCDERYSKTHLLSLGAQTCLILRAEQLHTTKPAPSNLTSLTTSFSSILENKNDSYDDFRNQFMKPVSEGGVGGDCNLLLAKDKESYQNVVIPPRVDVPESVEGDKDIGANYVPESCKWVPDMPRKLVYGPSCGSNKPICTGYVSCDRKNGGGVFVRLSTCGAENCSESRAVECTKQRYYFSRNPADETKVLPSGEAKRVLESKHSTVRPE
jgi:hypothetical protein